MTAFMFSCKMNVISYMLYTLGKLCHQLPWIGSAVWADAISTLGKMDDRKRKRNTFKNCYFVINFASFCTV